MSFFASVFSFIDLELEHTVYTQKQRISISRMLVKLTFVQVISQKTSEFAKACTVLWSCCAVGGRISPLLRLVQSSCSWSDPWRKA